MPCHFFVAYQLDDQYNYGSFGQTILTLLQVTLLSGWGDLFYVSYAGCHQSPVQ